MRRGNRRPPILQCGACGVARRSAEGKLKTRVLLLAFAGWFSAGSRQALGRLSAGSRQVLGRFLALRAEANLFDNLQIQMPILHKNSSTIIPNFIKSRPKSIQNRPKWCQGAPRTCNVQRATRKSANCVRPVKFLMPFFAIWVILGGILCQAGVQRGFQNPQFLHKNSKICEK